MRLEDAFRPSLSSSPPSLDPLVDLKSKRTYQQQLQKESSSSW